jgi:hypothetical protein
MLLLVPVCWTVLDTRCRHRVSNKVGACEDGLLPSSDRFERSEVEEPGSLAPSLSLMSPASLS